MSRRTTAIIFRITNIVLLLLAICLTAAGPGFVCKYYGGMSDPNAAGQGGCRDDTCFDPCDVKLDIGHWISRDAPPSNRLAGKFFVFLVEIIMFFATIGLLVIRLSRGDERKSRCEAVFLVSGAILLMVTGIVEVWYATGFSTLQTVGNQVVIFGWAFSACVLLISAILYGLDACLAGKE